MSIASLLACACSALNPPKTPIQRFSFNHDGTRGGKSFNWSVTRQEDGTGIFVYTNYLSRENRDLSDTVSVQFMDSLETLCNKYKVHRWNGFRGNNKHVCDGTGFTLYIRYQECKTVEAHGMNKFPRHYSEFRDELFELIKQTIWKEE